MRSGAFLGTGCSEPHTAHEDEDGVADEVYELNHCSLPVVATGHARLRVGEPVHAAHAVELVNGHVQSLGLLCSPVLCLCPSLLSCTPLAILRDPLERFFSVVYGWLVCASL